MKSGIHSILILMVLLVITFPANACTATLAAPSDNFPSSVEEPQTEASPGGVVISMPVNGNSSAFTNIVERLNKTLASLGQPVKFKVESNNGHNVYYSNMKAEMASGNPSCDAYALGIVESMGLYDENLTMDLTALLPQYAPVIYAKYKALLPDKITGIPAGIYNNPLWVKIAVMVRRDFDQQAGSIETLDGLFKFMDDVIVSQKQPYTVIATQDALLDQWALEQGYYNLGPFGVDGWLYAAIDDPACKPVPVESINGFGQFLSTMMAYYKNGTLTAASGRQAIAAVKNVCDYYTPNTGNWLEWLQGEYTAHLLSPDLPGYFSQPLYVNELAIPAACSKDKAETVMRFMDWLYSDQRNYDAIVNGKEGTDFMVSGGRLAILKDGEVPDMTHNEGPGSLYFTWPGFGTLHNSDYYRLPVDAPANIEELYSGGLKANLQFPLSQWVKIDRSSVISALKTTDDMKAVCKQRNETMNGLLFGEPVAFSSNKLNTYLFTLGQFKNDWLTGEYAGMIEEAMKTPAS